MNNRDCWLCGGHGGWEDHEAKQTIICPICNPQKAEHQSLARVDASSWCPQFWTEMKAAHIGPRFQTLPWLLVIHSGSISPGVAEYIHDPGDNRTVSAHLSWSILHNNLVQQVPFTHVAWHVKNNCKYNNNTRLNYCSIAIELPGPWDKKRDDREHDILRASVVYLLELMPSLKHCVGHQDIDPGRKKDPGPHFKWSVLKDLGLIGPHF